MESEGRGRTRKKRVPAGVGPEGKVYFKTIDVPTLKPGETPPEPESPPVKKVPAQRASVPLKDVDPEISDWTNH